MLAAQQLRLEAAITEKIKLDRRSADRARVIAEQTCPVCEQCDPAANGFVSRSTSWGRQASERSTRTGHALRVLLGQAGADA